MATASFVFDSQCPWTRAGIVLEDYWKTIVRITLFSLAVPALPCVVGSFPRELVLSHVNGGKRAKGLARGTLYASETRLSTCYDM
jgi:hypothetical protein